MIKTNKYFKVGVFFSPTIEDCSCSYMVSVEEAKNKGTLLKITDILGREVNPKKVIDNTTLFYIFDDGSVEKKLIIE